jgi:hypothetical protein
MHDGRPPNDDDEEKVTLLRRFPAHEEDFSGANDEALQIKLSVLAQEHADLDAAILALESQPHHDRLSVARLKKRKLLIKDQMQLVKDQMTPDIIA